MQGTVKRKPSQASLPELLMKTWNFPKYNASHFYIIISNATNYTDKKIMMQMYIRLASMCSYVDPELMSWWMGC